MSDVIPSPYEDGVDTGRALAAIGIRLASLAPLHARAASVGYGTGWQSDQWVRGVIAGYADHYTRRGA